jgi:hypothetical protein
MVKVADTRGSFVFCTTNTFKPFAKVKEAGSPTLITGAGPGLGACVLSTFVCANKATGMDIIMERNIFFMVILFNWKGIMVTFYFLDPFGT